MWRLAPWAHRDLVLAVELVLHVDEQRRVDRLLRALCPRALRLLEGARTAALAAPPAAGRGAPDGAPPAAAAAIAAAASSAFSSAAALPTK